ncbi:hypothetical protein [Streptomyces arenae]|nr:hypothetical protein [Streptomyces arenae]
MAHLDMRAHDGRVLAPDDVEVRNISPWSPPADSDRSGKQP